MGSPKKNQPPPTPLRRSIRSKRSHTKSTGHILYAKSDPKQTPNEELPLAFQSDSIKIVDYYGKPVEPSVGDKVIYADKQYKIVHQDPTISPKQYYVTNANQEIFRVFENYANSFAPSYNPDDEYRFSFILAPIREKQVQSSKKRGLPQTYSCELKVKPEAAQPLNVSKDSYSSLSTSPTCFYEAKARPSSRRKLSHHNKPPKLETARLAFPKTPTCAHLQSPHCKEDIRNSSKILFPDDSPTLTKI